MIGKLHTTKHTCYPVNWPAKGLCVLFRLISIMVFGFFVLNAGSAMADEPSYGHCTNSQIIIDLTGDLDGVWSNAGEPGLVPDGSCCDVGNNYRCMEVVIFLHEDAYAFEVVYEGASGNFYYLIDCENLIGLGKDDVIKYCISEPQEYYVITFCRTGNPTYNFTVTSLSSGNEDVQLAPFADVCIDNTPFELTGGMPAGGSYYINDSDDSYSHFDPAAWGEGEHTITYFYFDEDSGCMGVDEQTLTVYPLPELDCTDVAVCQNEPELNLSDVTGLSADGLFYFDGSVVSTFNPEDHVPGDYLFTYVYTDPVTGCSNSCDFIIIITPLPAVEDVQVVLCDDGNGVSVNLNDYTDLIFTGGDVAFGFYFDENLTNPVDNTADFAVIDGDAVYVEVTDNQTGCSVVVQLQFEVILFVAGDFTVVACDESADQLQVIYNVDLNDYNGNIFPHQPGITWTWFEDAGLVNPVAGVLPEAGHGDIFYVLVESAHCSDIAELTFQIDPLPEISCADTEFCIDADPVDLSAMITTSYASSFTGTGVFDDHWFDPALAGAGNHEVMVKVTDPVTGCENECIITITVHSLPVANDITVLICDQTGVGTASGVDLTVYQNAINNQDGMSFYFYFPDLNNPVPDPTNVVIEDNDIYLVLVENDITGCQNTATITFEVEIIDLDPVILFFCNESDDASELEIYNVDVTDFNYQIYPGAGVSYEWFEDAALTYPLDPLQDIINDGYEFYLVVSDGDCASTVPVTFTIKPLPVITFDDATLVFCIDVDPYDLTENVSLPATPEDGTFSGAEVSGTTFNPEAAGSGDHAITFSWTDSVTGCTHSETFIITVHPLPVVNDLDLSFCDYGDGVFLDLTGFEGSVCAESNLTFAWFADQDLTTPLADPSDTEVTDGMTVYVLVENELEPFCTEVATISFEVHSFVLTDITDAFCDESGSSSLEVYQLDLYSYNNDIISPADGLTFAWYLNADLTGYIVEGVEVTASHGQVFHVEVTDGFCTHTATLEVTVNPLPELVIQGDPIVECQNDGIFDLAGEEYVHPAGGVYSGPGVVGGIFDAHVAGHGIHEITYHFVDMHGCENQIAFIVSVLPIEPASCPESTEICLDATPLLLEGGLPAGGSYHGAGVEQAGDDYYFNPADAGAGNHTLTYIIEEEGCEDECTFVITVNALPVVVCPAPESFCQGSGMVLLPGGSPAGGVYTSDFLYEVNGEWFFNADTLPGTYTVEYLWTDPVTGCDNLCTQELTVHPLPEPQWPNPQAYCPNTGWVELTGALPLGGVYHGTFVDGGLFDTGATGAGNHTVFYTYTDENHCSAGVEAEITIFDAPVADAGDPINAGNCAEVQLNGSASGGASPYSWQWSPAALLDNPTIPNPQTIPLGSSTLFTLTVTDQNGCQDSDQVHVGVVNSGIVSLMPFSPVCTSQNFVELTGGSPAGGKYYVNNQTSPSDYVIPANLGPGEHQIHYVYTDLNGCSSSATQTLIIHPLPEIEWAGAEFCAYGGWVELEGALPEGGSYFGNHVINNRFNLTQAGPGLYSVYYTYTDDNGCSATTNALLKVHELPVADAGPDQTINVGETAWLEAADGGEGEYSYSWTPPVFVYNPWEQITQTRNLLFSQVFNLYVTDLETGCVAQDFTVVNISGGEVEIAAISYDSSVCFGESAIIEVLAGGGTPPYTYYWYDTPPPWDVDDDHLNPDINSPVWEFTPPETGTFNYYVLVNDSSDPVEYADGTAVIEVFGLPDVNLSDIAPVCANNPGYFFPDYELGIYSIFYQVDEHTYEIPIPYNPYPFFNPANIGEGEYTVVYEVTNEHGCSNSDETDFEILPYVEAEFYLRVPDRCYSNNISIRNDSQGGNSFVWDFGTDIADIEFPDGWTSDMAEFDLVYPTVTAPQEFTITLVIVDVDSGCDDVISRSFTVYPRAQALFTGEFDGCAPHTIQFEDQSTGQVLYHFWRFGDGSLSMDPNPEKTFYNFSPVDSVFTVSLTIATQDYYCTETHSADVTVYPQTVPGFAIDPVEHCSPWEAIFSNEALHADWITFDLGEGTLFVTDEPDTLQELTHLYTNLSATPDTLVVIQSIGLDRDGGQVCVKDFARQLVLLPQVEAVLETTNVAPETGEDFIAVCAPFTVEFSGINSLNGHSYAWIFDDGGTSSKAQPSHTFYNPTDEIIEREVILRTETFYGCVDYDTLVIHVLPEVYAGYTFLPQSGCSPLEVVFNNTSVSGSAITWSWSDGNGEFSLEQHPVHTFEHTLTESLPQEYQVQLLAVNAQGCRDSVASVITVNPEVRAHIYTEPVHTHGVLEVCISETISFFAKHTDGPSMHADYYDWSFGYGDASSVSMNPEFTYHQPGTYTVTLGASSQYDCSDETSLTVIVHPLPNPSFSVDVAQGCSPLDVNIGYSSAPVADWTYLWDFDFDGVADYTSYAHDALPPSHTFVNTGTEIKTFTMQLRIETPDGCGGEFSRDVVVWPEVSAVIETAPEHVSHELSSCAQFEVALDASQSLNATEYLWDFGDGITSTQASPVHTFLNFDPENAVTYNVLLTTRSQIGCMAQETLQVEVTPRPVAGFAVVMPSACTPAEVNFINSSIGATEYLWDFGDGNTSDEANPAHVYEVSADDPPATFIVTLRAINGGCENVYQQEITIYPGLVADFTFETTGDGCHPLAVNFTNTTTGHPDHLTFTWNYGDGNTSFTGNEIHQHIFENFSHDTDQPFTVSLTASYGDVCIDVIEKDILIPARPKALFTVPNSPGCAPHAIVVVNLSEGAVAFQWNFGDGSDLVFDEHPEPHTYTRTPEEGPGNYIIQLQVTGANDCVHVYEQEILIFPEIHALFFIDEAAGCHPHTVEFTNNSTGVDTYFWDYGNGHTSGIVGKLHSRTFNNFSHSEEEEFTVNLQVVSAFGCTDEASAEVTVYPVPEAAFHTSTVGGCSTLEVEFFNTSSGKDLTYAWVMDNGEETILVESPPAQFYEVGADQILTVFSPTLTVTNTQGCVDVITHDIYVYPEVEAAFEVNVSEGCHPLTVKITNLSEGDYNHLNFEWDYGDGNTSETKAGSHNHTFHNYSHDTDETFTLRLTARYADECVDVFEKEITVLARPKASFTVPNSPGCAPHPIEVVNQSLGAVSWNWNFGNGSEPVEEVNPDPVTYTQPAGEGAGVFTITLDVEGLNECTDQFTKDVVIFPEIEALFAASVDAGCHPLEIMLEDQSSGADLWFWNYGDGHTSQTNQTEHHHTFFNYDHVEEVHDTILLTVVSEFGCTSSFQRIVRVDPVPQAIFTSDLPGGCSPLEVNFQNHSVGATQYEWDMGDDTDLLNITAPQNYIYQVDPDNPPHIFTPVLTVSNDRGCTDTDTHEIWVYPDITAGFTASTIEGCDPLVVDFINITQGNSQIIHYKWIYGNGNMSVTSKKEHSHTFRNHSYTTDTTFVVSLRAYYSESCYDETDMEITVLARPKALFAVPRSPVCAPDSLEIINFSEGALWYTWDMGDGHEPLTEAHPGYYHYYVPAGSDAGVFTINLLTEAGNGCRHEYSLEVTVFPEIHALFAMDNHDGCHPLEVGFENQSQGVETYTWTMGDGEQSQDTPHLHTYLNYSSTQSVAYPVTLSVISPYGCEDFYADTVKVRPVPAAEMAVTETTGCSPFQPLITNLSEGGSKFIWSFGDENTAETFGDEVPAHTWHNTGEQPQNFNFMMEAVNEFGCSNTTSKTLTAFPEVTAEFVTADGFYSGCSPFDVRFENQSLLAAYYTWDFGDGSSSLVTNPLHAFKNNTPEPISYDVQLNAASIYGCKDSLTKQVNVYPTPEAFFGVTPFEQPYPHTTFTFTNHTNPGEFAYEWRFGDGGVSQSQDNVFTYSYMWDEEDLSTKTYQVVLNASNDYCFSEFSRMITITSPVPEARLSGVLHGCEPLEVAFENQSLYAWAWKWDFGDGTVSFEQHPVHTWHEHGIYDVTLVATGDGGADTIVVQVDVFENPTADFLLKDNLVLIPHEPLELINISKQGAYYLWEFGDGNNSTEYEPVHYYEKPGLYDITLTVWTNTDPQCVDTKVMDNGVRADESCQVLFPNAFKPSIAGPSGGVYNPSDLTNEVFHPLYEGVDSYELEIFTRWGELIYRTTDPAIGWDGYVRGTLAQAGVYVWRVRARCTTGQVIEKAGDVILIR